MELIVPLERANDYHDRGRGNRGGEPAMRTEVVSELDVRLDVIR